MNPDLRAVRYLGDGVYAGYDGYQVVLWVDSSAYGPGHICLDINVFNALLKYREDLSNVVVSSVEDIPKTI